jgi:sec-independent protein translocase protein TatC
MADEPDSGSDDGADDADAPADGADGHGDVDESGRPDGSEVEGEPGDGTDAEGADAEEADGSDAPGRPDESDDAADRAHPSPVPPEVPDDATDAEGDDGAEDAGEAGDVDDPDPDPDLPSGPDVDPEPASAPTDPPPDVDADAGEEPTDDDADAGDDPDLATPAWLSEVDDDGTGEVDLSGTSYEPPKMPDVEQEQVPDSDSDPGTVATDGDGVVADPDAGFAGGAADAYDPLEGFETDGPESDVEMPLTDHIEEMVRRLAVVFAVGGVVTLLLYPGADIANAAFGTNFVSATDVINFLWNRHIPGTEQFPERRPRLYGPLELLLTELKVAGLGGFVVGIPVLVYETYLFMRPGLYERERRYYLAAVPTSVVLAVIGVVFAHYAVLPAIFAYFTGYTQGTAVIAFGLRETFNLILILMGYMALVFQIPLFIMLAIMMDLVTPRWLRDRRLLFWGGFLGLSFIATPDPTGMAPIIVAATMIVLFEGTVAAVLWNDRRRGGGGGADAA